MFTDKKIYVFTLAMLKNSQNGWLYAPAVSIKEESRRNKMFPSHENDGLSVSRWLLCLLRVTIIEWHRLDIH